jgi:hypothetical protein
MSLEEINLEAVEPQATETTNEEQAITIQVETTQPRGEK